MGESDTPFELTEQMFALVGRAITQWSFVEKELSTLLGICLGGATLHKTLGYPVVPNSLSATWLFYAVENWRSKLQLVDAAMEAHLMNAAVRRELEPEWARLSDKANKLARKRNKLAHWFVLPAQYTGTGETHEPIAPARLFPPYGSPNYYRASGLSAPKMALSKTQVHHLMVAFHLLAGKIRDFGHKLASVKELHDKDVGQALDRLLLDDRLDPHLAEALKRDLPSPE